MIDDVTVVGKNGAAYCKDILKASKPARIIFMYAGNAYPEAEVIKQYTKLKGHAKITEVWLVDKYDPDRHGNVNAMGREAIANIRKVCGDDVNVYAYDFRRAREKAEVYAKMPNTVAMSIHMQTITMETSKDELTMIAIGKAMEDLRMIRYDQNRKAIQGHIYDMVHSELGEFHRLLLTALKLSVAVMWRDGRICTVTPAEGAEMAKLADASKFDKDVNVEFYRLFSETWPKKCSHMHVHKGDLYAVQTGRRGGHFIAVNGKKVYINV